ELWGLTPDTTTPERARALILEEDREPATAAWREACRLGGSHGYHYRIRRADDGAERLIRARVEVTLDADGAPVHGRGTHMDITDLAAAEGAAQQANAFFHAVLTATPDYIQVTDLATGAIIYGSPGKAVLGIPADELQALGPRALEALVHSADQQRVRDLSTAAGDLSDGQSLQFRYRAQHADGQWRWLSQSITPFRRDDSGAVVEILAVLRDVSDLVDAEERLTYAARHDVLTGLPNRTMLLDALDTALRRSAGEGGEIAVLFCDLDGFKHVNDTGGHSTGDAVLSETASRLRNVLRREDTVARVGGDEFVIVVEPWKSTDPDNPAGARRLGVRADRAMAVGVAERVIAALRPPITVNGVAHTVTASIGITYAVLGAGGRTVTADDVLHEADAAMYAAKARGKNRFEVFEREAEAALPHSRSAPGPAVRR
ncbi:MAG: hypothetical protein QOE24_3040, partial [Frankiales bacterium]|nr:hypothetical protein [Frankiales bacterium]